MQYTYHCFDWDDNLMFMPTNIVIFHKDTHEEVIMTTGDFALYRGFLGEYRKSVGQDKEFYVKKGFISEEKTKDVRNFKDYIYIGDDEHPSLNSFREFRDCESEYFLQHLALAVKNKDFGPEWNLFVKATQNKDIAKNCYIITARGHSAQTIYNGIKYLKEIGLIKNHIPRKNIFPVSHKKYKGSAATASGTKLKILKSVFTDANQQAKKEEKHHTVYFSDDDYKTFSLLKEKVTQYRTNTNYWMNIHIRLRFTGERKIKKKMVTL